MERFMERDEVEVHKNVKKTRPIFSHIDPTGSYIFSHTIYYMTKRLKPKNFAFALTKWAILSG